MWLDRILGFGQVVRDLSLGFACPFHCGGSLLLPFITGLSLGITLGISLSFGLFCCWLLHQPHPGLASPASTAPSPASSVIRRRLAGYLVHE